MAKFPITIQEYFLYKKCISKRAGHFTLNEADNISSFKVFHSHNNELKNYNIMKLKK